MSIFLSNCHHTFAKTDGSMGWPNSLEGDLLKQAHKEIKNLSEEVARLNWIIDCMEQSKAEEQGS